MFGLAQRREPYADTPLCNLVAVKGAIRDTGYNHTISVCFQHEANEVEIHPDTRLSRMMTHVSPVVPSAGKGCGLQYICYDSIACLESDPHHHLDLPNTLDHVSLPVPPNPTKLMRSHPFSSYFFAGGRWEIVTASCKSMESSQSKLARSRKTCTLRPLQMLPPRHPSRLLVLLIHLRPPLRPPRHGHGSLPSTWCS